MKWMPRWKPRYGASAQFFAVVDQQHRLTEVKPGWF
jgi:hypothetical protein